MVECMEVNTMKFILGALAAIVVTGIAFVQPAEARCFFNGFETVCVHRQHFGFDRPFYRDYGPSYSRDYGRPYWWGGY